MRKYLLLLLIVGLGIPFGMPAKGQTEFKNAMQEKYDLRSVSCFVCHERVERGTENPKQFRNELGKLFDKEFEGKDITTRLEEAHELDRDDPKRAEIIEEVTKEFMEVLEKIEEMEAPMGGTYKEAFEQGTIEGIRTR